MHFFTLQYITIHWATVEKLHITLLRGKTLHCIALHFSTVQYITLHYSACLYATIDCTTLLYVDCYVIQYSTVQYSIGYITCRWKACQAKGSTQEELARTLLNVLATCLTHIISVSSCRNPKWSKKAIHECKQVGRSRTKLWIQDSSPDTPGLPQQDGGVDECTEYNGVFLSVQHAAAMDTWQTSHMTC